jgi:type IV secretion system protein VirB10
MQKIVLLALFTGILAAAQQAPVQPSNGTPELKSRTEVPPVEKQPERVPKPLYVVPAGTKVPVELKQAVSTKNAQPGDAIYGQTNFPVVIDERVMIPAGTYVQGVIDRVKRAGRLKGTAEMQFHITTLIYPNGYTVDMAAAIDQVPGDESSRMKEPGTVAHDSEKGKDLERIGRGAAAGATIGGMAGAASNSVRGVGIGGLSGIAAGTLIGVLARGSDVRFERGTVIDVVVNHAIGLDPAKLTRAVN